MRFSRRLSTRESENSENMDDLTHVIEFSQDNRLLAFIDDSGKLKIWDTEKSKLRQEYVPNLHLASPIRCLKWIEVAVPKVTPKKVKKKKQVATTYLALGIDKGKVLLYSFAKGEIERTLNGQGHADAINDIYYNGGDFLYTCSSDSKVIKWSLNENYEVESFSVGKDKPTALMVTEEYIVTAANQIKIWDIQTKKLVRTLIGHSSPVTSLKYFSHNEKTYFISVSKSDKVLSLWCLENKTQEPAASFVTNDSIQQISFTFFDDILRLAAVNRVGNLHYYELKIDKINAAKPVKRKTNLLIVNTTDKGQAESVPIVAVNVQFDGGLLVAYGDRLLLRCEQITLDTNIKENVIERKNPKKPTKFTEDDTGHNLVVPAVEKNQVEYLNQVSSVKKTQKAFETPLETRLENMSVQSSLPQPKNMARLLVQGLHSKDSAILRTVFQTMDEETVRITLAKLPPQYTQPLIRELSQMMLMKTTHVKGAAFWMKILLQTHTSQLLTLGSQEMKDSLSVCLGVMDNRVATLPALSLLRGRLDLLAKQLKRSEDVVEDEIDVKDLLTFQDDSGELNIV